MKRDRQPPLFRFMLMRSFMPSVILLLVCVAFFVVLVVRSNIHNNQLRLAHQQ